MSNEMNEKLKQIQSIEQNLQMLAQQKQQFQTQLVESDSALNELSNTNQSFKIIGNIMVDTPKEHLQKEVNEKKEMLELRIKSFEKQENSLKEKFKSLQKEVMEEMNKASDNVKNEKEQ